MPKFTEYFKCQCGALTVCTDAGESYSCEDSAREKFFPGLDLRALKRNPQTYACDHCINHYGLDLCGCGSGEPFGRCDNDLPECKYPMQELGRYTKVRAQDAWF